jgi:hypothetical protein
MTRFLGVVVVVLIAVFAVGWYLDWFQVAKTDNGSSKTEVSVAVNKEKIKQDVNTAEKKVEELADKAKSKVQSPSPSGDTIKGTIASVDMATKTVMVMTAEKQGVPVEIRPDTRIRIGDRDGQLSDLSAGQSVTCVQAMKDGKAVCTSLTVVAQAKTGNSGG